MEKLILFLSLFLFVSCNSTEKQDETSKPAPEKNVENAEPQIVFDADSCYNFMQKQNILQKKCYFSVFFYKKRGKCAPLT